MSIALDDGGMLLLMNYVALISASFMEIAYRYLFPTPQKR